MPQPLSTLLLRFSAVVLVVLAAPAALAQAKPANGGTLSGHVVFADSDRPARFATLYLKPVTPTNPQDDFFTVLMDSAIGNMQQKQPGSEAPDEAARNLQSARAAAANFLGAVTDSMLSATIDAQGTYIVTGVPPGTYFLHVKAPGYVDTLAQFSAQDLATTDPTLRKRIFATVATVTISGDEQVREDLRLERGAALTGRLRYDDGSPATGWTVTALLKRTAADGPAPTIFGIDLSGLPIAQKLDHTLTDENGRFHIAGLPTGDYVLQANFTTAALDRQPFAPVASSSGSFLSILGGISALSGLRLSIYSGNTVHLHDAEVLSLRAGEERGVADLTVPLSSTRCISGILLAGADGHPLNSGAVQLIGQDSDGHDDPSLHFSADVRPDGTFRFDNVPAPSAYKLLSVRAADTSAGSIMRLLGSSISERKISRSYMPGATTIQLKDADIAGIKLTVQELSPAAAR